MSRFQGLPPERRMQLVAVLSVLAAVVISANVGLALVQFFRQRSEIQNVTHLARRDAVLTRRLAAVDHNATQKNVDARYSDCRAGERVRAGLRQQVRQGARTEPLLLRLVPSLNTVEVRAIVKASQREQLHRYAARNCTVYALAAVPANARSSYHVP